MKLRLSLWGSRSFLIPGPRQSMKPFILFGGQHLTALAFALMFSLFVVLIGRRSGSAVDRGNLQLRALTVLLLTVIVGAALFRHVYRLSNGTWSVLYDLPLQLCDWAAISVVFALCFPHSWIREPAYFWGVGGGLQALLTPELSFGFPHPRFLEFFISHAATIAGAFYITIGRNRPFPPGSIRRVFLAGQFFLVTALVVNWILGSNYGYVSGKSQSISLLDYLGPWPWYLFGMEIIGLTTLFLLFGLLRMTTTASETDALGSNRKSV